VGAGGRLRALGFTIVLCGLGASGRAAEDATPPAGAKGAPPPVPAGPAAEGQPKAGKRELNLVPLVGGDSDVGVGVGEIGDWARLQPGTGLFLWRLESGAFITFKWREQHLIIPFQDYFLLLTRRNWGAEKRWTLDVRVAFTDETTLKFYGIGNASPPPPAALDVSLTEYVGPQVRHRRRHTAAAWPDLRRARRSRLVARCEPVGAYFAAGEIF